MNSFLFAGDTRACLEHFFHRYRWEETQQFVAEYAHVDKGTVRHWKNGRVPAGDTLLRVRVLLDLAGYRVQEYVALPKPTQQFMQAIALGLTNIEEAVELLGYSKLDGVYGTVLRGQGIMPHRQYRLERYVENSTEELEQAMSEIRSKIERLPLEDMEEANLQPVLAPSPPTTGPPVEIEEVPEQIASIATSPRVVTSLARAVFEAYVMARDLLRSPDSKELLRSFREEMSDEELNVIIDTLETLKPPGPTTELHR